MILTLIFVIIILLFFYRMYGAEHPEYRVCQYIMCSSVVYWCKMVNVCRVRAKLCLFCLAVAIYNHTWFKRVWWDLGKGSGWVTSNAAARMVPVCRAFTRASWSTTRPETWRAITLQISVSERLNSKFFNRDRISPGDTFVHTSADVDQCCCGFHEGQLSVADQASGLRGEIGRQHHKVRLSQQVVHVLTVSRPNCLLFFNTPGQHREKMKKLKIKSVLLICCFKMFRGFWLPVTAVICLRASAKSSQNCQTPIFMPLCFGLQMYAFIKYIEIRLNITVWSWHTS